MKSLKTALLVFIIFAVSALGFEYNYIEEGVPSIEIVRGRASVSLVGAPFATPGEPNLPVKIINIALPLGKEAVLLHYSVVGEPIASSVEVIEVAIENFDTPWDSRPRIAKTSPPAAELIGTEYAYGIPIAQIKIRPVSYRPQTGTLFWNKRFSFNLVLEDSRIFRPSQARLAPTSAAIRAHALEQLVVNPEDLPHLSEAVPMEVLLAPTRNFPPMPGDDPADGVVIAADELVPYLSPLYNEIAFGIILEIIPVSEILTAYPSGVDRSERIREFIVDAYENWGISGVFLVGAIEDIPVRTRHGLNPTNGLPIDTPSDLYFTVMDGNWNSDGDMYFGEEEDDDFMPELIIGRFQPADTIEMKAYLEKIRINRWEIDTGFVSRWLFACANITPTSIAGQMLCDSIISAGPIPSGVEALKMYSLADSTGGDIEFTKENFLNELQNGRYLIFHFDHGYQYILHTSKITDGGRGVNIPEFMQMDNGPYFPFLHTYSCEVNAIDMESVGAAAVRSPNGGCVALLAHSRSAWSSHQYLVHKFWGQNLLASGKSVKVGEAVRKTIMDYPDDVLYRHYKAITTLFGYPFLDLFIGAPMEIDLSIVPDTLSPETPYILAIVTDAATSTPMESVLVVAYTADGRYAMDYTNATGEVALFCNPYDEDEIYITASGNGVLPVADTIPVAISSGPLVVVDSALYHELGGDGDIYPEPGDTFACNLIMHNIGSVTADTVTVRTACDGIIDTIGSCYDVAPGAICTLYNTFSFAVSSSLRGDRNLRPALRIYIGGFHSDDTLSVLLCGPKPYHYSTSYNDDGDDIPAPGDSGILSIGIANIGRGDFYNCSANIELTGASAITTHYAPGNLEAGDSLELNIPITVEDYSIEMNVSLTFANTSPESLYVLYSTPPPPNSLQMSAGAANIELWWEPPTDTSVIGYYIYRRDTVSGLWQRLDPFPVSSATYLDEGLSARSVFYYRVSSVDIWNNEGPMCDSILAWTTLPYLSPWPKSVGASMQIYASPVLFDTDNDGAQEIFVAGKSYAAVWAFHADGSDVIDSTSSVDPFAITAWDGSTPAEMAIWGSPAIGDVDGDGIYELLVNDRHSSKKIHLFSISDGSEKAGWPVSVKSPTLSTPVLADLDGDGILEIINATYSGIEAYRADGSEYVPGSGGVLNELEPDLDGTFWSSPAIGDIDGDGHIEIVLGGPRDASNLGTVWVFDDSGGLKPGWPARIPFEDFSIGSPTIANFDSDTTTLEILLNGGWYGTYIFKNNGDIMPGWPQTGYHFSLYASNCAAADFDGDGICEVIAAGSSKLGLHYANGTAMPGWPIEIDGNSNYIGNPTIGDVDGDGEWEILYTIQNKIYGFEVSGQPMPNYPLKMADDCYGAPTLGDVNGDGNIDIVVGCYDSRVYVWETGAPYSPEALAWPTQKGNFHRTGLYGDFWRLERIKEHKQALPRCSDIKIYPNPFNSTVTLELRGVGATYRSPGQIAVEIFDISGRLVYAPSPSVPLPMGEGGQVLLPLGEGFRMRASPWEKVAEGRMRAFTWQPDESVTSGIYLIRVTVDNKSVTKKAVYLK